MVTPVNPPADAALSVVVMHGADATPSADDDDANLGSEEDES